MLKALKCNWLLRRRRLYSRPQLHVIFLCFALCKSAFECLNTCMKSKCATTTAPPPISSIILLPPGYFTTQRLSYDLSINHIPPSLCCRDAHHRSGSTATLHSVCVCVSYKAHLSTFAAWYQRVNGYDCDDHTQGKRGRRREKRLIQAAAQWLGRRECVETNSGTAGGFVNTQREDKRKERQMAFWWELKRQLSETAVVHLWGSLCCKINELC